MKFYYTPGTEARATFIALEEARAGYVSIALDFSNEIGMADFREINPKGRVPALLTNEGLLTETPAILTFVAQRYPKAELAQLDDPFAFAQVQSFNSYLYAAMHAAYAHKVFGSHWSDEDVSSVEMPKKAKQTLGECFSHIEDQEFVGPYVMGENYTICDPYLYAVSSWMEGEGLDIEAYPKINAHRAKMEQRVAVQSVLAMEQIVSNAYIDEKSVEGSGDSANSKYSNETKSGFSATVELFRNWYSKQTGSVKTAVKTIGILAAINILFSGITNLWFIYPGIIIGAYIFLKSRSDR